MPPALHKRELMEHRPPTFCCDLGSLNIRTGPGWIFANAAFGWVLRLSTMDFYLFLVNNDLEIQIIEDTHE
jgi:hypothetical protein